MGRGKATPHRTRDSLPFPNPTIALRRSRRLMARDDQFKRLPDDIILKILSHLSRDAVALGRCRFVSKRFASLVSQSVTVGFKGSIDLLPKIPLRSILKLFPNLKYLSLELPTTSISPSSPAPPYIDSKRSLSRWKSVATSSGWLCVRLLIGFFSSPPPSPTVPSKVAFDGPHDWLGYSDVDFGWMSALAAGVCPRLAGSMASLTISSPGKGKAVVMGGSDGNFGNYSEVRCQAKFWDVERLELPSNKCIANCVKVIVVKPSDQPMELEKDVLELLNAFNDEDDDDDKRLGGLINETVMEMSRHYVKMKDGSGQ